MENIKTEKNQGISDQNVMIPLNLNISGMTCVNCASKIATKLNSLEGIGSANVILATESTKITFDISKIGIPNILSAIKDIGYKGVLSQIKVQVTPIDSKALDPSYISTLKTQINEISGIYGVTLSEKNEITILNVLFNSGEISETQVMKTLKSFPIGNIEIKKIQSLIEQEREEAQIELHKMINNVIISVIFLITIMILGQTMMRISYFMENPVRMKTARYVIFILTTFEHLIIGRIFYISAYKSLKERTTNMDVLISLGAGIAYIYSIWALFTNKPELFFMDSVMIFSFILIGKFLETKAKGKTSEALTKLFELKATSARRMTPDKKVENVDIDDIDVGDVLQIRPGDNIPLDGVIVWGESLIDESMITGESMPVSKKIDDLVIGGTINKNSALQIRVDKIGNDTVLSRIIEMVKNAQTEKPPMQRLADKVSEIFVPVVILLSLITYSVWYWGIGVGFEDSFLRMVSVIVVSCPCALGLAIPTAVMVGTGKGAKSGILIKGGESLEMIHRITHIVFDKTGTLTEGKPTVDKIIPYGSMSEDDILRISASLENVSEHPLGASIIEKAKEKHVEIEEVSNFKNFPGMGIVGTINSVLTLVGNKKLLDQNNVSYTMAESESDTLKKKGYTIVNVAQSNQIVGILAIKDKPKPNAKKVIAALHERGIKTSILTGDQQLTAQSIAQLLGIKDYYAEVLPSQKLEIISQIQKMDETNIVAMIGDGINDAPALTKADVGIAIGSGSDIAIESGDVVLLRGELSNLFAAIILSEKIYKKMKMNLFWAFIYNLIAIPFAAGVFYRSTEIFLPPGGASLLMALSSVSVVMSALLLKRLDLEEIKANLQENTTIREPETLQNLEIIPKEQKGEQKMAQHLECTLCGHSAELPIHCGKDMIEHEGKLVCWMNLDPKFGGMNCGEQEIPVHCDFPMKIV